MNQHKTEEIVLNVLSILLKQSFKVGNIVTRENNSSWDSLKHIEIMFAIEDEFKIQFSEEELGSIDCASKIIRAVESKRAT